MLLGNEAKESMLGFISRYSKKNHIIALWLSPFAQIRILFF